MPATPSPKHGISRAADGDFINSWPALQRAVVDWLDPNVATFSEADPRPAAGVSGRWHRHPVSGALSFDNGAAWLDVQWGAIGLADLATDVPVLNVGDQVATARQTLPASGRFAWCDGSLIRADLYVEYASAVGNAYNGGAPPGNDVDGHPLVRLPNKAGRGSIGAGLAQTLVGGAVAGAVAKARGGRGGEETHQLTIPELPAHSHPTGFDPSASGGFGIPAGTGITNPIASSTSNTGGNAPHNNLAPYEVDNWMVRIA